MNLPPLTRRLASPLFVLFLTVISAWFVYSILTLIPKSQPTTPKVDPTIIVISDPSSLSLPLLHRDSSYGGLKDLAQTLGIERVGVVVNQGANNYP